MLQIRLTQCEFKSHRINRDTTEISTPFKAKVSISSTSTINKAKTVITHVVFVLRQAKALKLIRL